MTHLDHLLYDDFGVGIVSLSHVKLSQELLEDCLLQTFPLEVILQRLLQDLQTSETTRRQLISLLELESIRSVAIVELMEPLEVTEL